MSCRLCVIKAKVLCQVIRERSQKSEAPVTHQNYGMILKVWEVSQLSLGHKITDRFVDHWGWCFTLPCTDGSLKLPRPHLQGALQSDVSGAAAARPGQVPRGREAFSCCIPVAELSPGRVLSYCRSDKPLLGTKEHAAGRQQEKDKSCGESRII